MLIGNFNMEFMPKKEFLNSIIFAGIAALGLAGPAAAEVHGFRDDFERENVGDAWTSHANSFSIRNGVLVASQLPDAGHGAVTRAQLDFRDAAIDFSFKYDGGERFNFVVDDKNCKEVHAGHICRVSFRKNGFTIQDDRTGVMNLEIRGLRDDPNPNMVQFKLVAITMINCS